MIPASAHSFLYSLKNFLSNESIYGCLPLSCQVCFADVSLSLYDIVQILLQNEETLFVWQGDMING